jgi:AcrR family transcriptional regulator
MALHLDKSVRREVILKNALEMVHEAGFESISVAAVAIRCDCGLSTVKAVFPNRKALWRSLVNYAEAVGDEATVKLARRIFPG